MLGIALRLLRNIIWIALSPLVLLVRRARSRRPMWLRVEISGAVRNVVRPRRTWDPRPEQFSVQALERDLAEAADDPSVRGVIVELGVLQCGWATCEALREHLTALRSKGKRTVAYLPLGGTTREYFVACACDEIHAPPGATLLVVGLSKSSTYLRDLLVRAGVRAEILSTGAYKSAGDALSRSEMSGAEREQMDALLDAIYDRLVAAIAEGRRLSVQLARERIDGGPYRPDQAAKAGLLDSVSYDDELRRHLWGDSNLQATRLARYARARRALRIWRPVRSVPIIAVLNVGGLIVSKLSPVLYRQAASAEAFVSATRHLRSQRRVRAVIVHVASGGGSALASDEMHHAITRLREKLPVCACFADVAASGGYYLAVACERIFARPTTVTGSIGVLMGKLDLSEALAKLGIGHQLLTRGARAALLSPAKALTDDERRALDRELSSTYELFLSRVADGRGQPREKIEVSAGGRVWAGVDAHERGLVDDLGGLPAAVRWARDRAGTRGALAEVRVIAVPRPVPEPPALPKVARLLLLLSRERVLMLSELDLDQL